MPICPWSEWWFNVTIESRKRFPSVKNIFCILPAVFCTVLEAWWTLNEYWNFVSNYIPSSKLTSSETVSCLVKRSCSKSLGFGCSVRRVMPWTLWLHLHRSLIWRKGAAREGVALQQKGAVGVTAGITVGITAGITAGITVGITVGVTAGCWQPGARPTGWVGKNVGRKCNFSCMHVSYKHKSLWVPVHGLTH